jgi:hypothetical protein
LVDFNENLLGEKSAKSTATKRTRRGKTAKPKAEETTTEESAS